jgi:hypothetical protein
MNRSSAVVGVAATMSGLVTSMPGMSPTAVQAYWATDWIMATRMAKVRGLDNPLPTGMTEKNRRGDRRTSLMVRNRPRKKP